MLNPNVKLPNFDFRGPSPVSMFLAFIILLASGLIWFMTGWYGWIAIGVFLAILNEYFV